MDFPATPKRRRKERRTLIQNEEKGGREKKKTIQRTMMECKDPLYSLAPFGKTDVHPSCEAKHRN